MDKTKIFFEELYKIYNSKEYISSDPIVFPHTLKGNREFVAFTSALFAYGNVTAMQKFLKGFFTECGTDPLALNPTKTLKYRFQSTADVNSYCKIMADIYKNYGSIENIFSGAATPIEGASKAMRLVHELMDEKTHGLNFLFSIPGKSASKRLHMFLRWMVRKDDVDFGVWKAYKPSDLFMPLDTHIQKISTILGIINEKESNAKALEKVNSFFKKLSPSDPVKYDFALTRLGIMNFCIYEKSKHCEDCLYGDRCLFI